MTKSLSVSVKTWNLGMLLTETIYPSRWHSREKQVKINSIKSCYDSFLGLTLKWCFTTEMICSCAPGAVFKSHPPLLRAVFFFFLHLDMQLCRDLSLPLFNSCFPLLFTIIFHCWSREAAVGVNGNELSKLKNKPVQNGSSQVLLVDSCLVFRLFSSPATIREHSE